MKGPGSVIWTVVLVVLLVMAFSRDAHGYIDPGTGSFVFQLLIAGLVGSAFAVRLFWKKITMFFGSLFSRNRKEEDSR